MSDVVDVVHSRGTDGSQLDQREDQEQDRNHTDANGHAYDHHHDHHHDRVHDHEHEHEHELLHHHEHEHEHDHDHDHDHDHESTDHDDRGAGSPNDMPQTQSGAKKKKKKKTKKKKKATPATVKNSFTLGSVPPEEPAAVEETPEQRQAWEKVLVRQAKTYVLPQEGLLDQSYRPMLDIFWTPACRSLQLVTPRLRLRQVEIGDTTAIRRIKMEPIVQRTQLYGSPSAASVKDTFQSRYVAAGMPRRYVHSGYREYIFAITARDPASITIGPPGGLKIAHRITSAEGWLGNFGLTLGTPMPHAPFLFPKPDETYRHPTLAQCASIGLQGTMFYEIHPQLWGQGLMSEAFEEVLRFAMEEVGCVSVSADPTTTNPASIRLCTKFGLQYTHTAADNPYGKPQMFHSISRDEWCARNGRDRVAVWGGKEVCRWCLNFRKAAPNVCCSGCNWAKYCSRECQRADWLLRGGHQSECDNNAK